ncbi:MAG TPA: 3-phosphoserine/phosphohydroxythreonine transaminase [Clostridia bacterium]|nr:3-phosphoserine/phosphohydroxythreonine transaminase [Clostridia bacterium]
MDRVFNFAAGPAALPLEVLEKAQQELCCYRDKGMSVMEMSHRSKMYLEIYEAAVASLRKLMAIPEDYAVLFLQGGATLQFSAVPLNLMTGSGTADYVDSGNFAHVALVEAKRYGKVRVVGDSSADGYTYIPELNPADFNADADYFHITTNNTIYGTRYPSLPKTGKVPLVADASSNILSEVYDIRDFGVLYAGAQKNIGPAGLTVVLARKDLLGHAHPLCPKVMDWAAMDKAESMLNTPATYGIYMAGLCFDWLLARGGVEAIEKVNIEKAQLLYDFIDNSSLYVNRVRPDCRSRMNVVFVTGSEELDAKFAKEAEKAGLANLKGHRAVGGMRASIYNAVPVEAIRALIAFMQKFEMENR